jgi:hypothetical protein
LGQQLAIELVHPTAVGLAAHVHDKGDIVPLEQLDELRDAMVAVADGIEHHLASLRVLLQGVSGLRSGT